MISLYDIGPTTHPGTQVTGASPFVRIIIFILRYKNLRYEIVPIGLTDIERVAKELGAAPTITFSSTKYTVPFIKDSTTGKVISDSSAIAQYLDEAYPDTPPVVPADSLILQRIFLSDAIGRVGNTYKAAIRPKLVGHFPKDYQEAASRGRVPQPTSSEVIEACEDGKVQFTKFSEILNGGAPLREFTMGARPTFADFGLVAFVYPAKFIYGAESDEWKEMRSWANGWVGWVTDKVVEITAVENSQ
ncbi:hypothetical protein PM082_023759 [Marasmius tenuissimus]|nr:hypothetical protein PM082_023759 [Marasmius tenuissimus]